MKTQNFIRGIVVLLLGTLYLLLSLDYQRGSLRNPGPGLFPVIIALSLIACGGLLMIKAFSRQGRREQLGEMWKGLPLRNLPTAAKVVGGIIVYLLIVTPLGFLLATSLLMVFLAWAMGGSRRVANMIVGLISVGILYWLFWTMMRVPLPQGTLWR